MFASPQDSADFELEVSVKTTTFATKGDQHKIFTRGGGHIASAHASVELQLVVSVEDAGEVDGKEFKMPNLTGMPAFAY